MPISNLLGFTVAEFKDINDNKIFLQRRLFPNSGIYFVRAYDEYNKISSVKKLIIYQAKMDFYRLNIIKKNCCHQRQFR
ncbi:hypothetical protein BH11BAC1_BH11BAC1_16360 [soil metagenome]